MTKEEEFENRMKTMTEVLRKFYGDEAVAKYIYWIIKSDTAKEYWIPKSTGDGYNSF